MNKQTPRLATEEGFKTLGHAAQRVIEQHKAYRETAIRTAMLKRMGPAARREVMAEALGIEMDEVRAAIEQAKTEIAANRNKPTIYDPEPYKANGAAHHLVRFEERRHDDCFDEDGGIDLRASQIWFVSALAEGRLL